MSGGTLQICNVLLNGTHPGSQASTIVLFTHFTVFEWVLSLFDDILFCLLLIEGGSSYHSLGDFDQHWLNWRLLPPVSQSSILLENILSRSVQLFTWIWFWWIPFIQRLDKLVSFRGNCGFSSPESIRIRLISVFLVRWTPMSWSSLENHKVGTLFLINII